MSKKSLWITAIILLFIGGMIGYGQFKQHREIQKKITHVTIGAFVPITGHLNIIGQHMRNGMELAKENLIAAGVVKNLNIIYEDACSEASSLTSTQKLINTDKVNVIASSFCIFGQDAVMPITEANKVIIFNTAGNSKELLNKKYGFSTNTTVEHEGGHVAEYAYKVLNARTAAIVHLDSSFGRGYRDGFTKTFEALGGKVIYTQPKIPVSKDFKAVMKQIKALNPDVLFIAHFGGSLGYAVKQAREVGIRSIIMGEYESEDPTVIRIARTATNNMIISTIELGHKTQKIKDFEKQYEHKFAEKPDIVASNAYDAVMLITHDYIDCKTNTDCMAKRFEAIKNYDGVSGNITINPDHSVIKPIGFKKINKGDFIKIDSVKTK